MKKLLLTLAAGAFASCAFAATVEEVITVDLFTQITKETTYTDVEYTSPITGITYAGNMCKANSANGNGMQFRTTSGKEAGLVTTANPNGAVIKSVAVEVSTSASTTNQWDVYGNAAAYATFKDLYNTETAGTLMGSGTTDATISATGAFVGFGFRANKNAIYIQKITITYETGAAAKEAANLVFNPTSVTVTMGDAFTAPTLTKDTDAAATFTTSNADVASVDAATGAVTINAIGTATITATTPETDVFYAGTVSYTIKVVAPQIKGELVTAMSDGKFFLVTPEGTAKNYTGTAAYGYLFLDADCKAQDNVVYASEEYQITFTGTDKGYTMVDARGKYMGMDATHFGSFNFYDTPDAEGSNCYWSVTFEGNDAKIENTGREGAYLSYKLYNNSYEIVTTDNADQPLVQLFKASSSAVSTIAVEAQEAAVEYYNLQGVRVENPANGLYIRRQGNQVTKVIIR